MSHQALARKYRPRRFAEVATQEHVSETLRRAVEGDRVGHAYLFCGPRGVGKTTLARVLAMALNCPDRGADGEPCGVCESCERIWAGHTALDVVEIDAASNRGVEDARTLRERAMYAPSDEDRYKVYIVDEAHMLTREAWNALLKILEEPPPRVIFVFATTEPQKIEQTAAPILSRCQRFDFRRIGVADIVARLSEVLEREGSTAPEEALRTIARKAEGGMRDGLSLLDQVLALTGDDIDAESVRSVLGLVDEERFVALIDLLAGGRHAEVFGFVEGLLDEGYDLVEFYHGWVDFLRGALRHRLGDASPGLRKDVRDALEGTATDLGPSELVRMLALSAELEGTGSLRRSASPRLLLETLFLRLSYLDRTVHLEELLRGLGSTTGGGPGGGATADPSGAETTRPDTAASRAETSPAGRTGSPPAAAGAGAATADSSSGPEGDALARAWSKVLEAGTGIPKGSSLFLRAAELSAEEGRVRLDVPAGIAAERLATVSARRTLQEALSAELGREIELSISLPDEEEEPSPAPRITPETVKEGRLNELIEREPLLRRAVEELDLELLD